jgi:hypothetical protein
MVIRLLANAGEAAGLDFKARSHMLLRHACGFAPWQTKGTTRGLCRPISGIRTSSIRCAIQS